MNKRSKLVHITPLPSHVPRSLVVDILHDHEEMIRLNPLVMDHRRCTVPPNASPDELQSVWYEITDKISYLPGGLITGSITYKACFHDLPNSLQTHVYAPAGVRIRGRWSVGGNMPGEPREPIELGKADVPMEGLYVREEVDLQCNVFLLGVTKKNLKKGHKELVRRLLNKADRLQTNNRNESPFRAPPRIFRTRSNSPSSLRSDAFYVTSDTAPRPHTSGQTHDSSDLGPMIAELPGSSPTTLVFPKQKENVNHSQRPFSGATEASRRIQSQSLSHQNRSGGHHGFSNYGKIDIPQPVTEYNENEGEDVPSPLQQHSPVDYQPRLPNYAHLSVDTNSSKPSLSSRESTSTRASGSSPLSQRPPIYLAYTPPRSRDPSLQSLAHSTVSINTNTHPSRYSNFVSRGTIVELPAFPTSLSPHSIESSRGTLKTLSSEVGSSLPSLPSLPRPPSTPPTTVGATSPSPPPVEKDTDREKEQTHLQTSSILPQSDEVDGAKGNQKRITIDNQTTHDHTHTKTTSTSNTEANRATEGDFDDAGSEKSIDLPLMLPDAVPVSAPSREVKLPAWKDDPVLLI